VSQASEDAAVFNAIGLTIAEANRLFFGAFAPLPQRGHDRDRWEARVAEMERALDILWNRHATKGGKP
jgi:hypothetical protein